MDKIYTAFAIASVIFVYRIFYSICFGDKQEERWKKWKKFKKDEECVLIGDETGFWGKKYIWKTKDGIIIKNDYEK